MTQTHGLAHTFVLPWGTYELPELKMPVVNQCSADQSWLRVSDTLEGITRKEGAALEDTIPGFRELPF